MGPLALELLMVVSQHVGRRILIQGPLHDQPLLLTNHGRQTEEQSHEGRGSRDREGQKERGERKKIKREERVRNLKPLSLRPTRNSPLWGIGLCTDRLVSS